MGAWDVSITGSDTARDLIDEYTCVFYHYKDDIQSGVKKLEEYFRSEYDADDEEEVCGFYYSLADFMWKKGILTEDVKQKALDMLDSGYGLDLWAESGDKILRDRKKALDKFREKITSPMGAVKKIKPNYNLTDIFTDGDLIAIQLQTSGKQYARSLYKQLTREEFEACDGKYVLMQKLKCRIGDGSAVVPEIADHKVYFRLFDGVYDTVPEITDISALKDANIYHLIGDPCLTSVFYSLDSSKMSFFKKHKYQLLGNFSVDEKYLEAPAVQLFLFDSKTVNKNAESELLSAMGWEFGISETDDMELITETIDHSTFYSQWLGSMTREEAEAQKAREREYVLAQLERVKTEGGKFFCIKCGGEAGIISVAKNRICDLYVRNYYHQIGLGTKLLEFAKEQAGEGAYAEIPECNYKQTIVHMCEKAGVKIVEV